MLVRILLIVLYIIILIIPGYTYFGVHHAETSSLFDPSLAISSRSLILFRLFGLYTFTLVWVQIMLSTFRIPLTRIFGRNVLPFHIASGIFTLFVATLHPLLFYTGYLLGQSHVPIWLAVSSYLGPLWMYGYLGVIAYFLIVITIATALLRKNPLITKYWRTIHYTNYVIFILVFLHSITIGSEAMVPPMQYLYFFFGITFAAALMYKRGIPLVKRRLTKPAMEPTQTQRTLPDPNKPVR